MDRRIKITKAAASEMPVIANLLQLYLYEFSGTMQTDLEEDGRYLWDGLEDYWTQEGLHPFLVRVEDRLAGFALVQRYSVLSQTQNCWDIEDFFVLSRYRRTGVGQRLAAHLFETFTGAWEIRVLRGNDPALQFWRKAISSRCKASLREVSTRINGRDFLVFHFET